MNTETMAGLGSARGPGESLVSWLRAGPLPLTAWVDETFEPFLSPSALYCPLCKVMEGRTARYYSRAEWQDPRRVICVVHCAPLVRCAAPPKRLRTPRLGREVRLQLAHLARWVEEWISLSPCTLAGRLVSASHCLQDQIFLALTEGDEEADSLALADWRLWIEGWPLSSRSHGSSAPQLGRVYSQDDRLAIVATTWKMWACLVGVRPMLWPALPIDSQSFFRLRKALFDTWPLLAPRLPLILTPRP